MANNKVKFGLKNVHYAMITETVSTDGTGAIISSYGDLKALAGAVNLTLSSSAEKSVFRADDSDYFVSWGQGGYDGSLEVARTKHCLYKVSAARPDLSSQTTGEGGTIDPVTETLNLTAIPRADNDHYIHLQTQESTSTAVVQAWYSAVPVPTFTPSP